MSLSMPIVLLSSVLALQGTPDAAAPSLTWEKSLSQGLQRSRAENRLLFADFWRDQCIWCIRLENETFSAASVAEVLKDLVLVKAKKEDHLKDLQSYGVVSFPTLVLLDSEGQALDIHPGFLGPEEFILWIRTFRDLHLRMVRLQGNLRKDPGDLASQLALGRLYANGGKRDEAKRCFEAIFKADAALQRAESAEACLEMSLLLRRAYEYTKALEFFAKARVTALARAESAAKAESAAAKKPDGPAPLAKPEVELLDKVLYELAATQILAKKKDALRATLDEYDRKVSTPDSRRHAWVLLKLGQACLEAGDDAKAREAWKRCDSLYSRSPEARECREAQALRNPGNQKE